MLQRGTRIQRLIIDILLIIGLLVSIFPFYWMIVMSTNRTSDIYSVPPKLFFGDQLSTNLSHVLQSITFFQSYFNTLVIACSITLLVLFFCSIAGFTFAKFDFPGKNVLFAFLIGTMILPPASSLVALFVIMADLHLIGTYLPEILPHLVPAFGVFWMRQYAISSIPNELIDAARIDGCGHFRLYWSVALPALRPALGFLGITTFIFAWNDYLWPLIVFNTPNLYTLQVSLAQLNGVYYTDYSMVMAGTFMATIP
ncbi:MAG TPA: carbohydrate ABC transporter permease, partial [Ktedonobacteraceae bacterium]|nr:carbohydrate ABC transporter permease [Ktedonobacteraceae bacterium]